MKKLAIYTANFGKKDDPIHFYGFEDSPYYDVFYFTDQIGCNLPFVNVISCPNIFGNYCMDAKFYKVFPHLFFSKYNYSLWLDSNMKLKAESLNIASFVEDHLHATGLISLYKHPDRDCVFKEAQAVIDMKKAEEIAVKDQIRCYEQEKIPPHAGLYACGFLLRRHNDQRVIDFNHTWWEEINATTLRDQLSFAFLAWYKKFPLNIIREGTYWENPYYTYFNHVR